MTMLTSALIVCLAGLQLADALSTLRFLELGGREFNPLLRWAFARWGAFRVLVLVKCAVVLALALQGPRLPDWALVVAMLGYVAVVAHNLRVINTLEKSR